MDQKVFDELMNKGVVTNVGLDAEDYTDIKDLQNKGFATSISAVEEYENASALSKEDIDNATQDVPVETPVETPVEIETPEETEGEL